MNSILSVDACGLSKFIDIQKISSIKKEMENNRNLCMYLLLIFLFQFYLLFSANWKTIYLTSLCFYHMRFSDYM